MQPIVYHYTDSREYLVDTLKFRQLRNPLFSLRALAKTMGFKTHSSLVLLCQGKRKIRPEHVPKLLQGLKLSGQEAEYFSSLVSYQNAETDEQCAFFESEMRRCYPAKEFSFLEVDKFRLVADWYHMAIIEMTQLSDFASSVEWLQKKLFFHVEREKLENAVQRLFQNGLLAKDKLGVWTKTKERLTTPKDFPSESIREHHRQVLGLGIVATESQAVTDRIFNSCAMTIAAKNLPKAQELIIRFREEMSKLVGVANGDATYQLTVAFFRLTQNDRKVEVSQKNERFGDSE